MSVQIVRSDEKSLEKVLNWSFSILGLEAGWRVNLRDLTSTRRTVDPGYNYSIFVYFA